MSEDKSYYSIGKVSALCNVPIKTLRYYDTIGLLVPDYRKDESNYRYYTQDQLLTLFIIRKLKLLGIPLKEIKEVVCGRDTVAMGKYIQERPGEIRLSIEELNNQYAEASCCWTASPGATTSWRRSTPAGAPRRSRWRISPSPR